MYSLDDTCTNCGKPHNGNFIIVMRMFKICDTCDSVGRKNDQLLDQGITIEKNDPSTGQVITATYYGYSK